MNKVLADYDTVIMAVHKAFKTKVNNLKMYIGESSPYTLTIFDKLYIIARKISKGQYPAHQLTNKFMDIVDYGVLLIMQNIMGTITIKDTNERLIKAYEDTLYLAQKIMASETFMPIKFYAKASIVSISDLMLQKTVELRKEKRISHHAIKELIKLINLSIFAQMKMLPKEEEKNISPTTGLP